MRAAVAWVFLAGCQLLWPFEPKPDAAPADVVAPEDVRHIFVTGTLYTGNLGGLAGADAKCADHAMRGGLTGTYLAWLSTAESSPAERMTRHPGPYRTIGEAPIADNWEDLIDGEIANPIRANEFGELPTEQFVCTGGEVWSNTRGDGTFEVTACGDWTDDLASGVVGSTTQQDTGWTYDPRCPLVSCSTIMSIFCVEQ